VGTGKEGNGMGRRGGKVRKARGRKG